jgi:uncharacterized membrane protein
MMDALYPDRSTRLVLTASLALNLFFAAFIAAQHAWPHRPPDPSTTPAAQEAASPMAMFERLLRALPAGDAAMLRMAFAARRDELAARHRDYAVALAAARIEIERTPLDPVKLRGAIEAARDARHALGPVFEEILMTALPQMSEDGRKILADYRPR